MEQMGTYKKGEELMASMHGGGGRGMWFGTSVEMKEGWRGMKTKANSSSNMTGVWIGT